MGSGNKPGYEVVVTPRAAIMLKDHARFLAQVSEEAALRLIDEFEARAKTLQDIPQRAPVLTDPLIPEGKYRKMLMAGRYLLIYQIKGRAVLIDAVVDTRQDYRWLL